MSTEGFITGIRLEVRGIFQCLTTLTILYSHQIILHEASGQTHKYHRYVELYFLSKHLLFLTRIPIKTLYQKWRGSGIIYGLVPKSRASGKEGRSDQVRDANGWNFIY